MANDPRQDIVPEFCGRDGTGGVCRQADGSTEWIVLHDGELCEVCIAAERYWRITVLRDDSCMFVSEGVSRASWPGRAAYPTSTHGERVRLTVEVLNGV